MANQSDKVKAIMEAYKLQLSGEPQLSSKRALSYLEHILAEQLGGGIRTMTPLENQWTDYKKILSELVVYLEDYREQTQDYAPGNRYWGKKLEDIVERARKAISATAQEGGSDEHGNHFIPDEVRLGDWCFLDCTCEYCKARRNQIAKRKIEEYCDKHNISIYDYRILLDCIAWLDKDGER